MKNVIKIFVITIAITGTLGLTACNTFEGMGRDVEKGGEGMQRAADKNR